MTDLILTEKFSVASDFAKALGVKTKGDGCFTGNGFVITWAVGHLVTLCEPEDYDTALKKWRLETLPLIPESFEYKPIKKSYKQFTAEPYWILRITFSNDKGKWDGTWFRGKDIRLTDQRKKDHPSSRKRR
ncbi:MAG: hypothetical protein LC660_09545 [Desulfobacteraceae bacterium]|nr:hypothetical protein [Desulfobacteraceae bacterium]